MKVMINESGHYSLAEARWMTEAEAARYISRGMYLAAQETPLPRITWRDLPALLGGRRADGWLPGGNTVTWVLSPEEEGRIIDLNARREGEMVAQAAEAELVAAATRQAAIAEAQHTSKPQALRTYTVDCDGSTCECSYDVVTILVNGTGHISTRRTHTY